VRQREDKCKFALFLLRTVLSLFTAVVFLHAPSLFFCCTLATRKREKNLGPTSVFLQVKKGPSLGARCRAASGCRGRPPLKNHRSKNGVSARTTARGIMVKSGALDGTTVQLRCH
jgi:hypothetical protein